MEDIINEIGCITILQPYTTLRNISLLRSYVKETYTGNQNPSTWYSLCKLMHRDLIDVIKKTDPPELVWFDARNNIFKQALVHLMGDLEIPSDVEYSTEEKYHFEQQFNSAIQLLAEKFPKTYQPLKDLISFIIIGRRKGYEGGTTSNRIGLIWLSPDANWTLSNWVENIIHEYIHNVLFLDDMINSIFLVNTKQLQAEDALAISAIRKEKRGYDKSYHSAFVSYGIINHYLHLEQDANALEFINPLIICISDLITKTKVISENGLKNLYELAGDALKLKEKMITNNAILQTG